jgi:hypothetical protein
MPDLRISDLGISDLGMHFPVTVTPEIIFMESKEGY